MTARKEAQSVIKLIETVCGKIEYAQHRAEDSSVKNYLSQAKSAAIRALQVSEGHG